MAYPSDPIDRLDRAGRRWGKAKDAERAAAAACYEAIRDVIDAGYSEMGAAKVAGVDRMTVRRALGKR